MAKIFLSRVDLKHNCVRQEAEWGRGNEIAIFSWLLALKTPWPVLYLKVTKCIFCLIFFKWCYGWEVLMAHPLVVTQISQLHPDFIRAIVGVNALYFYLAVKPPRFICIKAAVQRKGLLWRPMVLQRDLWARDNSKVESWSMEGSLAWCVESNRNSSRKIPHLEAVTSSRRAMMPHQASAEGLPKS